MWQQIISDQRAKNYKLSLAEQTEKQIYEEIEKKEELQRAFERDWNRLMAAANQDMERALAKSKKVN